MGSDYYKTMQNGGRQAASASKDTRKAIAELTEQLNSAKSVALNLSGAFAGAFATSHLISLADEWNSVNARLKQASQSTDDFSSSQRMLMDISQKTGTSFSDNANLFSRSAASMREYGYSSEQVLDITEAISTGLKLSGANAQESSSVITQFSQALAQGVLRGEEFNSVNESGDRVIRALAAGMGVARKDLKSMADQGQLTIDKVVPALISQLGNLRNEYGELPQTVSSSATKVENAFMQWVGGANEATGATRTLTGILDDLSNHIDTAATAAGILVSVGVARYFGSIALGAKSATVDLIGAAKSEIALAQAQVRGAQVATARARADVYRAKQALLSAKNIDEQAQAERRLTAAQSSLSKNIAARTSAQTSLNAVTSAGSRLMSGALGLVGGIPGIVLLGAGAWYTMYQNQEQARRSAQEYMGVMDDIKSKTQGMTLPETTDNQAKTRQALDEQNRLVDEQTSKVLGLKKEIEGYQYMLANPGMTINGYMLNHLMSLDDATQGLSEATSTLVIEQERLAQMQSKSQSIQQVLEGLEHRRVALIRQQGDEQNRAYQSLITMNGQHTELNRLLGLGNNLLMARQGLVNAPMRVPQADLSQKQGDALEKSRRDLELSRLKGEEKERKRLGYAADDLGLTNDPKYQTGRQELIDNGLAEWRNNEANKPKRKPGKTELEKTGDIYDRLIKQQKEQIALGSQNTELAKVKYQVTQGELSSLDQAKKEILLQNAALIDQKSIAEQLKTFREGLADSNAAARERGNVDFLGAGMGDQARERMKEMADIRADFVKQQQDLQRSFSKGQISEDLYKQQTEALRAALAERLDIQQEYYKKTDEQRSDWQAGISDALMNYADQTADLSSMAASATSEILNSTTDSISSNLTSVMTGATSFKEGMSNIFTSLGETIIQTLIKMAAQALITKAIMAAFGGDSGGGESGGGIFGSLGSLFSFNALGGVYDSPSLSAYSNGVYSTPQLFAFAKGAGVFGEAGPEAIMPLTRSADGSLGVRAIGQQSQAVQDATKKQGERIQSSVGDINVHYSFTGKPDDAMLQAMDAHGKRLSKQIKSDLTQGLITAQGQFGKAINGYFSRTRKE